MDNHFGKLTVYFEDPFWVGVFERIENGKLSVCKVTFGEQPKDCEVWQFILEKYYQLKFSRSVDVVVKKQATSPKRVQREVRKQTAATGSGTKSQQALQLQREANKLERKTIHREQQQAEKQRRFELKQQKGQASRQIMPPCFSLYIIRLVIHLSSLQNYKIFLSFLLIGGAN